MATPEDDDLAQRRAEHVEGLAVLKDQRDREVKAVKQKTAAVEIPTAPVRPWRDVVGR